MDDQCPQIRRACKEDGAPIMDVRWDQVLDSLEMDRQAIIDCAERLRASLASLKSDSRKIKDLATGEAYAGLFSELLLAVDRVKNEPLSEDLRSSIADEIIEVCSHYGLESVLCDETVNLHEHEIVGLIKTDDAFKDGKVARVERDGYRIGGRLLRPARVVVFRHEEG